MCHSQKEISTDHMYVTNPENVRKCHVANSGLSEHYPTCLVHKVIGHTKGQHNSIRYRSYKNLDTKNLIEDLEMIPWSILDLFDDVDDALYMFVSLLEDVLNEHIPWREKCVKRLKQPDWMTEDILKAISTRYILYIVQDNENYKIWHNKVAQMIRNSKRDYCIAIIEQYISDSSKFWQCFRELDPKSTAPPPPKLKEEDDIQTL